MTRYAMVIDQGMCIGCHSCTIACKKQNELPLETIYNPVVTEGVQGTYPNVHLTFTPLLCMHCANPPCTTSCPTKASRQDEDGIVWVDPDYCMGCKVCIQSCPYGMRSSHPDEGYARKCNFCKDRVRDEGKDPYCVTTCHQNARIFGDLDDPNSEVSKLVGNVKTERIFPELGTDPQVYYIPHLGGKR